VSRIPIGTFEPDGADEVVRELVAAGWVGYLPGHALDLYAAISRVSADGGPATEGGIRHFLLACGPPVPRALVGDFDGPLVPDSGLDDEERAGDLDRWAAFRAEAARHGVPVATPAGALELLCRLGLISRAGEGWLPVLPPPLVEDVVELSHGERRAVVSMRAHVRLAAEKRRVAEWLKRRGGRAGEPVVTSVAAIAETLTLEPSAVRLALALLAEDGVLEGKPVRHPSPPGPPERRPRTLNGRGRSRVGRLRCR
jgi:hypothetical protein